MASLAGPTNPFPRPFNRRAQIRNRPRPDPQPSNGPANGNTLTVTERIFDLAKVKEMEARDRKEETNRKIASQKAISIILRREATKAVIEKKKGIIPRNFCPELFLKPFTSASPLCAGSLLLRSVFSFESVTLNLILISFVLIDDSRIEWEKVKCSVDELNTENVITSKPSSGERRKGILSPRFRPCLFANQVFELLHEQLWYRPNSGIYIKLIVMLGKCKQPEKAHILFQAMIGEGCVVDREAYTALMSAYSRSGLLDKAFLILEQMKKIPNCQPDVFTYSILIKSCLQVYDFGKATRVSTRRLDHELHTQSFWWQRTNRNDGKVLRKVSERRHRTKHQNVQHTLRFLRQNRNYEKMSAVMQYMQKYHFSWTLVTYNIVIDAFGRAGDLKQMEFLFRLMQSERIKPNCVTLCSLVRAYGHAGKAEKIAAVLRFVDNSDVMLDTVFFNCLVDAYGMMGCFSEMKGVIEMMKRRGCKPDKITYRTMIKAYMMSGMNSHAKELQNELASL
ncbi:hypothetical protein DH2020_000554 [Rehmannia glutinosa]|uniref:Pentatricopeptide repeat-containing protein n=1 Tax=Rehmannia glutinosa TaxID=99300 RepID=A0ABR0XWU7_REHGL